MVRKNSAASPPRTFMLLSLCRRGAATGRVACTRVVSRRMCDAASLEGYEEELQRGMIKPPSFYAEEGAKLRWFYWIDSNGRLYIEDVLPKNIATSLKSPKFLEFVARPAAAPDRRRDPGARPARRGVVVAACALCAVAVCLFHRQPRVCGRPSDRRPPHACPAFSSASSGPTRRGCTKSTRTCRRAARK